MLPQTQVLKGVAAKINYSLALHFYHYRTNQPKTGATENIFWLSL